MAQPFFSDRDIALPTVAMWVLFHVLLSTMTAFLILIFFLKKKWEEK